MILLTPSSKNKNGLRLDYFDLIWIILSAFFALAVRGREFIDPQNFPLEIPQTYLYSLITISCTIPYFIFFRLGQSVHHLFSVKDIISIFTATILSILTSVYFSFFMNRMDGIPRSVPIIYGCILVFGLIFYRVMYRIYDGHISIKNSTNDEIKELKLFKNVILIGLDHFSINLIRLTDAQQPRAIKVLSVFSPNNRHVGRLMGGVSILGDLDKIGDVIAEYQIHGVKIDEIWISDNVTDIAPSQINKILEASERYEFKFKKISEALNLVHDESFDIIIRKDSYKKVLIDNHYYNYKRIIDLIMSNILIILFIPLIGFMSFLIMVDVGLPIFFWQERIGRFGRKIYLYKLRTLADPNNTFTVTHDHTERQSYVGALIRKLHIDELPQLLNIIVGEMSLIGPRPLLEKDQPDDASIRLLIRPGITGWAQINGGEKLTKEEKNTLDCWYVFNASLLLDVLITLRTVQLLFSGSTVNQSAINSARAWMEDHHDLVKQYKISAKS